MRAAIYARISQDRYGAGLGVARQREDCERLIADRGWQLVGVYEDNDISAYSGKLRPGYRRLLEDIERGELNAVVAWHTDRLHRSPRELEEWIDACERKDVITVTVRAGELDLATAAGRMVARMLGAAARHESEQKAERVRRAREQAARAGQAHGPLGFGYVRDPVTGEWQIEPTEAAIVREIADRLLAGESLRGIAVDLNARGVPTPKKAPHGWRAPNIRQLIAAGRYCGWREWTPALTRGGRGRGYGMGELVAEGDWPAILTREETERIRVLLSDPARRTGRAAQYLLSGILRCGICGGPLNAHLNSKQGFRRYHCFSQPGMNRCGGISVAGPAVEKHVVTQLLAALTDTPLRPAAVDDRARATEEAALTAIAADRQRLEELAADYAEGRISRQEWLRVRDIVAARVEAAESSLRGTRHAAVLRHLPRSATDLVRAWNKDMSLEQQRAVVRAVVERIVVHPANRRSPQFDPSRVEIIWRV